MTPKTGIWCVVVVSVVAGGTVVGNSRVCAVEWIKIVVDGKGCRRPIRRGGVAACAIRRQIQRHVVWVGTLVVIRRMAPRAGIGRIVVIAVVAGNAVVRNGHVRSSEWVDCIMVKSRRRPGRFRMASRAIGRELIGGVVGVCGLVELRRMATNAGVWRIVVIAVVAGGAIVCDGGVRAIQSIKIIMDSKGGRRPTGAGGVARGAIG